MATKIQVTRYAASDGRVFDDIRDADRHEAKIEVGVLMERLPHPYDECDFGDVVAFILDNAAEMTRILSPIIDSSSHPKKEMK